MREINFLMIFAIGLALALFSLENIQLATIKIIPGFEVEAPLAVELILAMGIGAILAWLYIVWNRLQHQLEFTRSRQQLQNKDQEIDALRQNIERCQAEIEKQRQLPPSSQSPSWESGASD